MDVHKGKRKFRFGVQKYSRNEHGIFLFLLILKIFFLAPLPKLFFGKLYDACKFQDSLKRVRKMHSSKKRKGYKIGNCNSKMGYNVIGKFLLSCLILVFVSYATW